jgi:hypothetical protein
MKYALQPFHFHFGTFCTEITKDMGLGRHMHICRIQKTIYYIPWAGYVARMGEKRNAYRLLVGKPEGKETTRKT